MICTKCLTEIPEENKFCGSCGAQKVEKSNYEETRDLAKMAMKSYGQLWFTIGFFKGMGHEIRDKKYINTLIESWNKDERDTAKDYKEMLKFWREFHGEDIDNFGKKEVKNKRKTA